MSKVYCKDCKWYKLETGFDEEHCLAGFYEKEDYKNKWTIYWAPNRVNKNNDCKDYCSLFEEKKKTITLYRYTYEDDGEVWISNWTSKQRGLPRGCSVLKTETKEIDL